MCLVYSLFILQGLNIFSYIAGFNSEMCLVYSLFILQGLNIFHILQGLSVFSTFRTPTQIDPRSVDPAIGGPLHMQPQIAVPLTLRQRPGITRVVRRPWDHKRP